MLWEQFIGPSLKAVRTLVIRPLQGYGSATPLSYPDTWVREPDCLNLPYTSHGVSPKGNMYKAQNKEETMK